ncbi:MFS transporter [bacterium]|nr:MFS transporter [bacterium]
MHASPDLPKQQSSEKLGRGFSALMATQFLGGLNDSFFKLIVTLLIADTVTDPTRQSFLVGLARALLVLPFIIFAAQMGYFADRFSKTKIIRFTKVIEILLAAFAVPFLVTKHVEGLLLMCFLLGLHSAVFSPCKYGIIPEIVSSDKLSRANGYLEFWTFLASLLGTVLGAATRSHGSGLGISATIVVVIALSGLISSLLIPLTRSQAEDVRFPFNPLTGMGQTWKEIRNNRSLHLVLWAMIYFFFVATAFDVTLLLMAKNVLNLPDAEIALLYTALAIGIGSGSVVAGVLTQGSYNLGLVPLGGVGMAFWNFCLAVFPTVPYPWVFLVGFSGGFFVVPLNAYFQHNSPAAKRGRYLSLNNALSFIFMLVASFIPWLCIDLPHSFGFSGIDARHIFLAIAVGALLVTILIIKIIPESVLRTLNWILTHTIYRVRVYGSANIPETGGALLVCNHTSFVDPLLLLGAVHRPIRFLIYRPIYETFPVSLGAKTMKAIPISTTDGPKSLVQSLKTAREYIEQGDLVCIFAEGAITRIGTTLPFQDGFTRIMKGVDAKIIPVYLDQLWGSVFSFAGGKFFFKKPRRFPYPVTVNFGNPIPADSKPGAVRKSVLELGSESRKVREDLGTLPARIYQALVSSKRYAISDGANEPLSGVRVYALARIFSRKLKTKLQPKERVGILLPPGPASIIANIACLITGAIPINLNYTFPEAMCEALIKRFGISRVFSSSLFLRKIAWKDFSNYQDVGEILTAIVKTKSGKFSIFLLELALKATPSLFRPQIAKQLKPDDLAIMLLTSGSSGMPKGVMLSHRNLLSNVDAISEVVDLKHTDSMLGVLPIFHALGFSATFLLPILKDLPVSYAASPFDGIGKILTEKRSTILLATPTFLRQYLKKYTKEELSSLRLIIVGAEKLHQSLREETKSILGIEPFEGYGATELAPVVALNVPNYESEGLRQIGHKAGSVGHPLPGVVAKVVDPETFLDLPLDTPGLLLVKGPNVFLGYEGDEFKTAQVLIDGWYSTGDIAYIDADGFIHLAGRLSRFAKIGGEMVPLERLEELMLDGISSGSLVVTALPDDKRGERLVVVHTQEINPEAVLAKLRESQVPNLWIPAARDFICVDAIPILGSGKVDLQAIRELAAKRLSS